MSAIILVFAVSLILSNIFYRHQIDVSQAARSLHSDQAFLIALSGEGWATELLFEETIYFGSFAIPSLGRYSRNLVSSVSYTPKKQQKNCSLIILNN